MTEFDPHAARPRRGTTKALEVGSISARRDPMVGPARERTPRYFPPTRGALSVSGVLDMAPADAAGGEDEGAPFACRLPAGKDVFVALPTPTNFDITPRRRGVNRPSGCHPPEPVSETTRGYRRTGGIECSTGADSPACQIDVERHPLHTRPISQEGVGMRKLAAVVVVACLMATAFVLAPPVTAAGKVPTREIDFGRCDEAFLRKAHARCGFLSVPLDYADPSGSRSSWPCPGSGTRHPTPTTKESCS